MDTNRPKRGLNAFKYESFGLLSKALSEISRQPYSFSFFIRHYREVERNGKEQKPRKRNASTLSPVKSNSGFFAKAAKLVQDTRPIILGPCFREYNQLTPEQRVFYVQEQMRETERFKTEEI